MRLNEARRILSEEIKAPTIERVSLTRDKKSFSTKPGKAGGKMSLTRWRVTGIAKTGKKVSKTFETNRDAVKLFNRLKAHYDTLNTISESKWRKADLNRKARANPRFSKEWLDSDHYVMSLPAKHHPGWPYVGAIVDNDDWVTDTDGRAMNGEQIVDFGKGWAVVEVDWR